MKFIFGEDGMPQTEWASTAALESEFHNQKGKLENGAR